MTRPLSDLPKVMADMATAAERAQARACADATKVVLAAVNATGSRHRRIHVQLKGKSDVKGFNTSGGIIGGATIGKVSRGRVQGVPRAFWTWVEEGTHPHIIVGKSLRSGKRSSRKSRAKKAIGLKARKAFGAAASGSLANPLKIPGIGYREYAFHKGAHSTGKPWAEAMAVSERLVPASVAKSANTEFLRVWR